MSVTHHSKIQINDNRENLYDEDLVSQFTDKGTFKYEVEFADGSSANQAQQEYRATLTILANDDELLDLAGGVLNIHGETITFATVRELIVRNKQTTSGENITVGGLATPTGSNLFSELFDVDTGARIRVKAGGVVCVVAPLDGYTVTGGSADGLLIDNNNASTVTVEVIVKGTGTAA